MLEWLEFCTEYLRNGATKDVYFDDIYDEYNDLGYYQFCV